MSRFTATVKKDAKIWLQNYETDFPKRSLNDYLKTNNLTKEQYIREVKQEIRENKKEIYKIHYKENNREAQKRFREKNKKRRYVG